MTLSEQQANIIQNCAFYAVQLQIIYLLNLQYNVSLTHSSSVIAVPLVKTKPKLNFGFPHTVTGYQSDVYDMLWWIRGFRTRRTR